MTAELNDVFRTVTRIRIVAFLSGCDEAEFGAVQEYCDLSPSNLSKNVSALEGIGYVTSRKGYVGKKPRTWLALTDGGRSALVSHMAALQEIADSAARHA
jgi:DNA-binding MarR family transcriptional regulator